MKKVWVVDDDRSIRWVLERALKKAEIPCQVFENADDVLENLKTSVPSVLVSDIRMPGKNGLELLTLVKERVPNLPVIVMTAFSDLDSAVNSFQRGAFEYLAKPFDVEKAVELIRRGMDESTTDSEDSEEDEKAPEIIGKAVAMQEVFRAIGKLSQSSVTVLLTGESGAGKEVVARALHRHSPRARKEFIALNMAAIPRELMESELFGHERGAFTGANAIRHGRFEQAEGGTLFLDEIGDMPSELQTRLLRVLSDGYYYRVGGHQALKANVRIIAATNKNLEEMVKRGEFREDLYHRLNVIRLKLPPLRDRAEDIPLLAHYFMGKSAKNLNVETKKIAPDAMEFLQNFPFPGNVRQLENLCNWLTVMAPTQTVHVVDLPEEIRSGNAGQVKRDYGENKAGDSGDGDVSALGNQDGQLGTDWLAILEKEVMERLNNHEANVMKTVSDKFEKAVLKAALSVTKGRKVEAAERLGIGRNTITRKLQELNL